MSQPLPDALFGVDGTESPELSGRDSWSDVPHLPPLPITPDIRMLQETVAAALSEDPFEPAEQEPSAPSAEVAAPDAAPADAPPQQPPPAPTATGVPGPRPAEPIAAVPVQPDRSRLTAASARSPLLRGRIAPPRPGAPRQGRSNGGAGVVLLIAVITIATLLYYIIIGIYEALIRLIP